MPLHLILLMMAAIAFMLWLAFADGGEAELHELQAETDTPSDPVRLRADSDMRVRRPGA